MKIAGAIIAGGQSRRMNGSEKSLLMLNERPLLSHVVERMTPQVESLSINANGNSDRFSNHGLPVIPDAPSERAGPLSGLATVLEDSAKKDGITHLATAPADCPFLPKNLVERLANSLVTSSDIAIAGSRGRNHPVIGLWPIALAQQLRTHFETARKLSVMGFLETVDWHCVEFDTDQPGGIDPFFNINTPDDLEVARQTLSAGGNSAN